MSVASESERGVRPRSRVRRALRGLGYALGTVVVLLAIAIALLHSGPGQRWLGRTVQAALAERLTGTVELGGVEAKLFGVLAVRELRVSDASGEVLGLDALVIRPSWSSLVRGRIVVERVELTGLRVAIEQHEDGSSNLKRLVKPRPASAPGEKRRSRRVVAREIELRGIEVSLKKPDGSRLVVSNAELRASLDAIASDKTVTFTSDRIALDLERTSAQGTKLAVRKLETGITVELVDGAGTVKLLPLAARLRIERPARPAFETPIALGVLTLNVKPGELGALLAELELGLLVVQSLELEAAHANDALAGPQRATLVGLRLEHERLAALLGKDVLRHDVDVRAAIQGPPHALAVKLAVGSDAAKLALSGTVNAEKLDRPAYDLRLVASSLDTKQLVGGEGAPEVAVDELELRVRGTGVQRDSIAAEIELDVGKSRVGRIAIDGAKLRARFERGVLVIRELTLTALRQKLRAEGRYVVSTREIDMKLALSGDVGEALRAVKSAGLPVRSQLPAGAVRFAPGELELSAKGRLDDAILLRLPKAKVRIAGGAAIVDATLALRRAAPDRDGKRALTLDTVDADVRLQSLDLGTLAALGGRDLGRYPGTLNGSIELRGTKRAPRVAAELRLDGRPKGSDAALSVVVRARGDRAHQRVSVIADRVTAETRDRLVELDADLPLALDGKPRLRRGRRLAAKLDLPRRRLGDLIELLPADLRDRLHQLPRDAELEAELDLSGTSDAPRGTFRLSASGEVVPFAESAQGLELSGRIEPEARGARLVARLEAWLDRNQPPALRAEAGARFERSPLVPGGARELDWTLDLAVPEQQLASLPLIASRGLSGAIGLTAKLEGNRRDLRGEVTLRAARVRKADLGPFDGALAVKLGDDSTALDLSLRAAELDALSARGRVGVAGRGLIPALREKRLGDPSLELAVTLPRHSFAEWSRLRPKLAGLRGGIGGALEVRGSVKQPLVDATIDADGFEQMNGKPGRARLTLAAGRERVALDIALGPRDRPALALALDAERAALIRVVRSRQGIEHVEIGLKARAHTTLGEVVPRLTARLESLRASGKLDWDMTGTLAFESRDGERKLVDGALVGSLSLSRGHVPIPGTRRSYRDVELALSSRADGLKLEKLSLTESDRENPRRRLTASGSVALSRLRPERVTLALRAHDWLLFGGETLGKPDAPRGALTARIDVDGSVAGATRTIDVTVRELELRMPDRFEKAHWPEQTSLGDVAYLGDPGVVRGKLTRPPPMPAPHARPFDPEKVRTLVRLRIPAAIHAQKPPFDMLAKGALDVRLVEGEARPRIHGEIVVLDGHMDLGGRDHRIDRRKRSRIYFDDAHPGGELDLYVALRPHPAVLKDVSRASAGGDDVRIHLVGPIAKPVSTVTGVGNADLWDILPVHNAGRVKFASQPDLPASSTAQVPREYDVVLLSYMAANLPHNLILDRINAWSDAYDDRFAYGKIRHLEAERYSESGKTRVRVLSRPPTTGQSNAELEGGYLLLNRARTKAGVGVVAGSRAGGGPALFFEWASDD